MNTQLHQTDTVFATVIAGGNTLINMTLSGYNTISDIIKSVCSRLKGVVGLVSIELRNVTCGWQERRLLKLRRPVVTISANAAPVQLTLF